MSADTPPASVPESVFGAPYLRTTLGMFILVFLVAFENMAVTTVMPLVSDILHGRELFALSFAAPLASGMVGMVAAGEVSDRRGPAKPLYVAVALFVIGLLICGTAMDMGILVAGRLLQGVGGGAISVGLYVLVARYYPMPLHAKIFAIFSAAWVLPALIGPWIAGIVATHLGWRWVFLGVLAFVALAFLFVLPTLRNLEQEDHQELGRVSRRRLLWAAGAAAAVIGMNLFGAMPRLGPLVLCACLAAALAVIRPLLPAGALFARRGLSATVLTRALISGAFFTTEVYLPYMLRDDYFLAPDMAGLILSGSTLNWFLGSAFQARSTSKMGNHTAISLGAVAVGCAIASALVASVWHTPVLALMLSWAVGGFGMGIIYPRQTVQLLALSSVRDQGFNSSALNLADALGSAGATAIGGVLFVVAVAGHGFSVVFAFTLVLAVVLVLIAPRCKDPV